MNILAIDPANLTGWCTEKASGVFNCESKGYTSAGMKLLKFKKEIQELVSRFSIDLIVYERPSGRHFTGIRSHSNYEGVLVNYCLEEGILFKEYSASKIKKFFTGKGNANKGLMLLKAMEYKSEVEDDNEADAIALYQLAKSEL